MSARQDWAETTKAAPRPASGVGGPRDLSYPPAPRPSQACARGPRGAGGGSALPREWTHGKEEGTREEHGVITFQRNEVRAPLFPI